MCFGVLVYCSHVSSTICLFSSELTHSTFEPLAIDLFSLTRFLMVFPSRFLVEDSSTVCTGYFNWRLQHLVHSFLMYRQTCFAFASFATPFCLKCPGFFSILCNLLSTQVFRALADLKPPKVVSSGDVVLL